MAEPDVAASVRASFALFKPLLDRGPGRRPWVIGQLGQSVDGCVATRAGDSRFVTSPENIVHLHRLRALCDGVLVGAGTVAADDPRLTTREVQGEHPVRIVLDPDLRSPADARLFHDDAAPTWLVCDARLAASAAARGGRAAVVPVQGLLREAAKDADAKHGNTQVANVHDDARAGDIDRLARLDLAAALRALHTRGIDLLFVEGGGVTVSRFLAQGMLDRLHLAIAPLIIGPGRRGLVWPGADRLADCPRPPARLHRMGADALWDFDFGAASSGDSR